MVSASGAGPGPGTIMIGDITNQTVSVGMNASFFCDASSIDGGIVSYSWDRNGLPLMEGLTPGGSVVSGTSDDTLVVEGVTDENEGGYSCTVSDGGGSVDTSNTAFLTAGKSVHSR